MVIAVKRPAGETRGKVAAGPDAGQCHRASPRPYICLCHLADLQYVDGLGELSGAPGAAAELPEDPPGLELGVRALAW